MNIRFRLADSPSELFSALHLGTVERDRAPEVGDAHQHGGDAYRVVKVMHDVDPEHGSATRGPVVYVVRIDTAPAPPLALFGGELPLSFAANTAKGLRDCIERANVARRSGDSERYRRHVEEFIFLSNAVSRLLGPPASVRATPVPFLPVFSEGDGIVRSIRNGLIDAGFAAQIESATSLSQLRQVLDRADASRATLFIVAEQMRLRSGLAALHAIRSHPLTRHMPILVLTRPEQSGQELVATLAMSAGASGHLAFSEDPDWHRSLAESISETLRPGRSIRDQA